MKKIKTKAPFLIKNKKKRISLLFGLLFLAYTYLIWLKFSSVLSQFSNQFGYLDGQHHWRVLEDFVKLRVPFRDYFLSPSHGWAYLLFQSIPYLLSGKTFLGILGIEFIFLPVVGVILSYLVAKNILGKKHLILLFLFFCLLFRVNYHFTSPRHLIAELSLSFFILYLLKRKDHYLLVSGLIAGVSALTSFEYAAALNLTLLLILLTSLLTRIKLVKPFFKKFVLGQGIILVPFFSWLWLKGALKDFWHYTLNFLNNFYHASPCAVNSFPRLEEIESLAPFSRLLIFEIPIEFLKKINFYLVFAFFAISGLFLLFLFLKNRKFSRENLVKLSLVIYGSLIFTRTIDTPCVGYFIYGLVPFFLLLVPLIEKLFLWGVKNKSLVFKNLGFLGVGIIFIWLILTEDSGTFIKLFGEKEIVVELPKYEREFYPPSGWFVRKDLVEGYKEITDFIKENSSRNDFLYVYPWGHYNNLTERPAPNGLPTAAHFLVGEEFVVKSRLELETKKPKFVVINLFNATAFYGKTGEGIGRYFSLRDEDGPVFPGEGNLVEKYILENYKPILNNNVAVIMEQRSTPITIKTTKEEKYTWLPGEEATIGLESMRKTSDGLNYEIIGKEASWTFNLEDPVWASDIAIEVKLDGDFLTKHLTRYFLNFYAITEGSDQGESSKKEVKALARKAWQTVKIEFNQPRKIRELGIEIGDNAGLVWWLDPHNLAIRKISLYEY